MSLDQAIQDLWQNDFVQKNPRKSYHDYYPAEYAAVAAYLNGGQEPVASAVSSRLGKGLVAVEKERRAATPPTPTPPDPTPPGGPSLPTPYLRFDSSTWNLLGYRAGDMLAPWGSIQTCVDWGGAGGPGYPGVAGVPSGRVAVVAAPDGNGKAVRFNLPDSDPPWPHDTSVQRTQISSDAWHTWSKNAYTPGEIRWFEYELWLPWNKPAGEYFEVPSAGADFCTLAGLHPDAPNPPSTPWGVFDLVLDDFSHPQYLQQNLAGGVSPDGHKPDPNYPVKLYNMLQLTNADGSPYMKSYNRRVKIQIGGKFASDTTGWLEAWVDGVNVIPRVSHPTTWQSDYSTYWKFGPYHNLGAKCPLHGAMTIYLCKIAIG